MLHSPSSVIGYTFWSTILGKYCTDGAVTGDCAAGYWCRLGSPTPFPENNGTTCGLDYLGELCPFGYYCPEGTTSPVNCPAGEVTGIMGAANITQCDVCPAGYYCPDILPVLCPPGDYCPAASDAPTPCPERTYNPIAGKFLWTLNLQNLF